MATYLSLFASPLYICNIMVTIYVDVLYWVCPSVGRSRAFESTEIEGTFAFSSFLK